MLTEEDFSERNSCMERKVDMSKYTDKAKLRIMFTVLRNMWKKYNNDL
jgi:hypothetical protein